MLWLLIEVDLNANASEPRKLHHAVIKKNGIANVVHKLK